jgi:valyl-tRNA synthetase
MDKWILSCLFTAVSACNAGFQQYDFPRATSAIYNFFHYELCDVYLVSPFKLYITKMICIFAFSFDLQEAVKPVFQGSDESAKSAARSVRIETLPPSICVAPYSTDAEFQVWKDEELEENVKLVSRIVSNVRSVRANYMLPNKTKTKLVLRCLDQKLILFKSWKYALVII